jgi:undecaprenyl pyrophosphate phosphatase UppP
VKPSKVLVRLETLIALAAGVLGIITAFWHDWIEILTGWDPDRHNGSVEWLIVAVLLGVAAAMGLLARHHHRQLLVYDRELADPGT